LVGDLPLTWRCLTTVAAPQYGGERAGYSRGVFWSKMGTTGNLALGYGEAMAHR